MLQHALILIMLACYDKVSTYCISEFRNTVVGDIVVTLRVPQKGTLSDLSVIWYDVKCLDFNTIPMSVLTAG